MFRTGKSSMTNMSAKAIIDMCKNADRGLDNSLESIFAQLRGLAEFWATKRRDLRTMTQDLGAPTFFLTLSPAEYHWDEMAAFLIAMNKDVPNIEKMRNGERCSFDPVMMCKFMHRRFRIFFEKVIKNKNGPLSEVIDFFWRIEYQARGLPHYHMVLWVKDAHKIYENMKAEIQAFITKYISCHWPSPQEDPILHKLVSLYQHHECSPGYCQKPRKVGKHFTRKCRFHFPRTVSTECVLRDPLETCARRWKNCDSTCRLYDLPRRSHEMKVNDFNIDCLKLWKGNMDIQYIGDKTNAIVNYIVSYITKRELTQLATLWKQVEENGTLKGRLFRFALKSLSMRECGIYEAVDILTGQALYGKSRQTQWLGAREPSERTQVLKRMGQIRKIAEDEESTDVFENSWISDYYPNRPAHTELTSLYEFRRWYDKWTDKKPGTDSYNRYGNVKGLDWNMDDAGDEDENEAAVPKDRIEVLQNKKGKIRRRLKAYLINHPVFDVSQEPEKYYYSLLLMFMPFRDESAELRPEGKTLKEFFHEQLEVYPDLKAHHEKLQEQYMQSEKTREKLEALGAILENEDESEDSTALRAWAKEYKKVIWVAAPTGVAATNIDAMTVHRLLKLPVQHGTEISYQALSDMASSEMRHK